VKVTVKAAGGLADYTPLKRPLVAFVNRGLDRTAGVVRSLPEFTERPFLDPPAVPAVASVFVGSVPLPVVPDPIVQDIPVDAIPVVEPVPFVVDQPVVEPVVL
jgi:hypothetical protein